MTNAATALAGGTGRGTQQRAPVSVETRTLDLGLEPLTGGQGDGDNITDWCLEQFRTVYADPNITKDGIWEYLYGVMHAPDWRERYHSDLQKNLPRIPFAADFEAFRIAGAELMELHVGFETCPEHSGVTPIVRRDTKTDSWFEVTACDGDVLLVRPWQSHQPQLDLESDSEPDSQTGLLPASLLRITSRMRLQANGTELWISETCRLVRIPPEAHDYTVSGRSPLKWACDTLKVAVDERTGIRKDPNGWHAWADDPFGLIRHLRRLVHLSVRSAEVIASLPPSLDGPHGPDALAATQVTAQAATTRPGEHC